MTKVRLWFCRVLGWHGRYKIAGSDGASVHATCGHCGYEGMIDSQGNLSR